jgi:hypothetical protein
MEPDKRKVVIHGLDQLQEPTGGRLALVWMRLAQNTASGRSVPELIDEVTNLLDDPAPVLRGLAELGYRDADRASYPDRFEVLEEGTFEVSDGFPRLVRQDLRGDAVLAGVGEVAYTIDLDSAPARAARIAGYAGFLTGDS